MKSNEAWTYEQYRTLPDDARYEILDGILVTEPAPGVPHQVIVYRLSRAMGRCLAEHEQDFLFASPIDVV